MSQHEPIKPHNPYVVHYEERYKDIIAREVFTYYDPDREGIPFRMQVMGIDRSGRNVWVSIDMNGATVHSAFHGPYDD